MLLIFTNVFMQQINRKQQKLELKSQSSAKTLSLMELRHGCIKEI